MKNKRFRKHSWHEREKSRSKEGKGNRRALSSHRDQKMEGTGAKRNACQREKESRRGSKEGRGEEDRQAGHLREMDLGAPRGHILFSFEAPDKSNAAECIIR